MAYPSNSGGPAGFAGDQLKSFVERIERIEEDIKSLNDDKRDVYTEAKSNGFDVKVLKEVIRIRRQDRSEREEHEAVLDLYLQALGMILPRDRDDAPPEPKPSPSRAPARDSDDPISSL